MTKKGKDLGNSNHTIGCLIIILIIAAVITYLVYPIYSVLSFISKRDQTISKMRWISLPLEEYYKINKHYPNQKTYEAGIDWINYSDYNFENESFIDLFSRNQKIKYFNFEAQQKNNPNLPSYVLYSCGPDKKYDLLDLFKQPQSITSKDDLIVKQYDSTNGTFSSGDIIRIGEPPIN